MTTATPGARASATAADESRRAALLRELGILDSAPETSFDALTKAAAMLTGCRLAAVSLLDGRRQWFKSAYGTALTETPIEGSFCAHAALEEGLLEIEDARADPRFADKPTVLGEPCIRFYAGRPLVLDGVCIGTLCVLDTQPARLTPARRQALHALADAATELIVARQARVALDRQRRRLADVALASGDWLWEADAELRIEWSAGGAVCASSRPEFSRGSRLPDGPLLDARGTPTLPVQTFHGLLRAGRGVVRATLSQETGAGPVYRSFSAVPWVDANGRAAGFRGTASDVTEAVRLERERAQAELAVRIERDVATRESRLRSELVSRVSHELRTPLNAMLGFSQLLLREPRNTELYATHIHRAGTHLLGLVNDMLDLARLESGSSRIDVHAISTATLVQRCLDLLEPEARKRDVALEYEAGPGTEFVMAAPRALIQALLNLVNNALTFSPPGASVVVRAQRTPQGRLEIEVIDRGPGIAAEQLSLLFQPFSQLPGPRGRQGTGLGLAISQQIARAMGGEISVLSRLGEGSTFTLTLDAGEPGSAPHASDFGSLQSAPAAGSAAPLRVLYVEDDPVNALLLEHMLQHIGSVTLHAAATAQQGLALAARVQLDLILLDMNLPDGHGVDVVRSLRAEALAPGVRVVALSADAEPAAIEAARAAGFDDYLTKPLDLGTLERLLARMRSMTGEPASR